MGGIQERWFRDLSVSLLQLAAEQYVSVINNAKSKDVCKIVKKSFGRYLGKIPPMDYNFFSVVQSGNRMNSEHTFKNTKNVAIM
jgi:hypothetical protein